MLVASVLSLVLSSASAAPAQAGQSPQSIVVVGRAIDNAKERLAACLARKCPPNEDIDASLALAENQLLAGKYREARFTLIAALRRNKHEAETYPVPVSDLYRANGRVAAHLGYDEDYYRSTWGIYRTLKKGLPEAKDRRYSAMMEVAEMMGATRGHERARLYYDIVARDALQDGRPDIAALAKLRSTLRHMPPYLRENAVREIAESTDPRTRAAQLEAKLALARMAFENSELAKGDAIVRDLARLDIKRPILVYSPAWEVAGGQDTSKAAAITVNAFTANPGAGGPGAAESLSKSAIPHPHPSATFGTHHMALNVEDMWMDVGFRIGPDGKVSELKVLRSHGDTGWADPLLASIGGRRYTPAKPGSPTSYRTERYTYTSGLEPGTGTHLAQHSPKARVEYFDLSDISAPD